MSQAIESLNLPELVDRLADLEGRRTPVGWSQTDATERARVEAEIMAALARNVEPQVRTNSPRVGCRVPVAVRTTQGQLPAEVTCMGLGGVFVRANRRSPGVGHRVEIEVKGGSDQHGLRVRGNVSWESADGFGVTFVDASPAHERRLRRFMLELVHNLDS